MKWSIFVSFVVCLARLCDSLALKCPPGDSSCTEERILINTQEASTSEVLDAQCLAGSKWESNCHFCRCSNNGVAECVKQDVCLQGVFAEPVLCKPNTTFQRDCNRCLCLDNGQGLCTLMSCRRLDSLPSAPELVEESISEFGDIKDEPTLNSEKTEIVVPTVIIERKEKRKFYSQIDVDTYIENISVIITDIMNCTFAEWDALVYKNQYPGDAENLFELGHDVIILKRSTICKPLEEFMRDCNPCKCSRDGLSFSCTHNECLETETDEDKEVEVFMQSEGSDHIERHSVCRARNTFYIGCNTCHCNSLGTDYSCTNKPCPLPADVELFHELKLTKSAQSSKNKTKSQVCEANRMFIKDCNTCWCNEDGTGYYCTRRVCVPLLPDEDADLGGIPAENLRVIKKECRPDEVFELDCNMCRCNPDGKSYACTRRACEEPEDRKKITLSRKVRAFTTEPPKACQPGQEFRMDCNKCLCDNKGQDFSCTRIDCNALNNNHHASAFTGTRSKRELAAVPMPCEPGSVFDRGCNVCRCTAEGNHATCTLKQCKTTQEDHAHDLGFRCNPGEQFKRDCNDCTCSADGKSVFCTLRLCDQDITPDNI